MTRLKRTVSMLLCVGVLMSLFCVTPSAAMQGWVYRFQLGISTGKNSKCKNGNIYANLYFNGRRDKETAQMPNTDKSGENTEVYFKTTRAPWMLYYAELSNPSKDGLKINWISLWVRREEDTNGWKMLLPITYPASSSSDDGIWIETEKGSGNASSYEKSVWAERDITAAGNLNESSSNFGGTVYVDTAWAAGNSNVVTCKYDGTVVDETYQDILGKRYNCMNMSDAPTMSISAEGMKGGSREQISFATLKDAKGAGFEEINENGYLMGFKYDKKKLAAFMNQYNVNYLTVKTQLKFPALSTKRMDRCTFSQTLTFVRKAFAVDAPVLSGSPGQPYASDTPNNNYYNAEGVSGGIQIKLPIKNDATYNKHLNGSGRFRDATLSFDKATLTLGNTGDKLELGKTTLKLSDNSFMLHFPYQKGKTSQNDNLKLSIEGATLKLKNSNEIYVLWDEYANKATYSQLLSGYKLDAEVPEVVLTPTDGKPLQKTWRQYVYLTSKSNKTLIAGNKSGQYTLEVLQETADGLRPVQVFDRYAKKTTALSVPAAAGSSMSTSISLAELAEGSFTLRLTGRDAAGNKLEQQVTDVYLDCKEPEASIEEQRDTKPAGDGSLSGIYQLSVTDASGTGRLYYCFTDSPYGSAPSFDESTAQEHTSGTIDSTLNKWAFVDQSDVTDGKTAAAVVKVKQGDRFRGRIFYFAKDAFGNRTSVRSRDIDINNESTDCLIVAQEDSATPHASYTIEITTPSANNKVHYRWKDARGNYYPYQQYAAGSAVGAAKQPFWDDTTIVMDGSYTLECRVTTPSGMSKTYTKDFVFDNAAPELNVTVKAPDTYRKSQTVTVKGTDVSGITQAWAQVVRPDGTAIDGQEEFPLTVTGGILSQDITFSDLPSGAYALRVRAVDAGGCEGVLDASSYAPYDSEMPRFYIRDTAPSVQAELKGVATYREMPLLASTQYDVNLTVSESFIHADKAGLQQLYWRISDDMQSYTAWEPLGNMTAQGDAMTYDAVLHSPMTALMDGENTLYLQTTIAPPSTNLTDVDPDLVDTAVLKCYLDEVAPPIYNVDMEDMHTRENIVATVQVRDNTDAPVTLTCKESSVTIEKTDASDMFTVTAAENVNTVLEATDLAGHVTEIPFVVTGIDREAPTATVTQNVTTHSGARQDATATIRIENVKNGTVQFALIPTAETDAAMVNGKIDEKYFSACTQTAGVALQSTTAATWTGEENLTYAVTLAGITGDYRIGLHMADSLENETDVILPEILSAQDAQAELLDETVLPKETGDRAKATASFNVPVYVLPQEKITQTADTKEGLSLEETNLELAKQSATNYAQDYSFIVTENKDYTLYTVDTLGRTKTFTFKAEGITFGALEGVNVQILVDGEELAPGKLAPAEYYGSRTKVVITPKGSGQLIRDVNWGNYNWEGIDGFSPIEEECVQDSADPSGYTKLVYNVTQDYYMDEYFERHISQSNERFMEFYVFTPLATQDTWGTTIASVANLDNTEPEVTVNVTPKLAEEESMYDPAPGASASPNDGLLFTRGNVTYTVTLEDPDSGLSEIRLNPFRKLLGSGRDAMYQESEELMTDEIIIPLMNDDGSGIDYITTPWTKTLTDSEGNTVVTFTLSGTDDPKGIKTLLMVFEQNALGQIECINGAGMTTPLMSPIGWLEGQIGTLNISRLPAIAENVDYYIEYEYETQEGYWSVFVPSGSEYYQKAKATVRLTDKGVERGLEVVNNGHSFTKELNSYVPGFTFKLEDQYGATAEADVLLTGFDDKPGIISYVLSTTAKTKDPVTLTVTAKDNESGVASVTLTDKTGNAIALSQKPETEAGSVYEGQLAANGAYCITMIDKAGNKTTKNVSVSNIDNVVPTATVAYSIDQKSSKSSKNVSAQLTYSKPDVRITSVDPDLSTKESSYTVNYGSSTLYFTENGTVTVFFVDAYGNEGSQEVTVKSIYRQAPALSAITTVSEDNMSVTVTFEKATDPQMGVPIDTVRELTDLTVMYGGMARRVQEVDKEGNIVEAAYTFGENGAYTFKVYDDNGNTSYLTVEISGIDKKAPEIRQIRWHYEYDVKVGDTWTTQVEEGSRDVGGEVGYIMATDRYKPTNRDVTITVVTDDDTRPIGSTEAFAKETEKVFTDNGMYIFNMEKQNRLSDAYAVDVEVIDKTPPVLTLSAPELVFYENQEVGEPYSKDLLAKPGEAFTAYDLVGGKKKDLTQDVQITYDQRFNPDDILSNVFDRSISYLIQYSVSDEAHNITSATRSVRLVGMYDTIALVNGNLPDAAGRCEVDGGKFTIELMNFSGTAYAKYASGLLTMGQMKADGDILYRGENGKFELSGVKEGWYTVLLQTDKRDYILLQIYVYE